MSKPQKPYFSAKYAQSKNNRVSGKTYNVQTSKNQVKSYPNKKYVKSTPSKFDYSNMFANLSNFDPKLYSHAQNKPIPSKKVVSSNKKRFTSKND